MTELEQLKAMRERNRVAMAREAAQKAASAWLDVARAQATVEALTATGRIPSTPNLQNLSLPRTALGREILSAFTKEAHHVQTRD